MYEQWNFEQAGKRDASDLGAQCIPCKHVAEKEGNKLESGGTCGYLAHVKLDLRAVSIIPKLPETKLKLIWQSCATKYSAGTDSCVLAELFVDMPAFDLNLFA
ncbi:TPA: hypothetical protein ACH3X1_011661 [Trebouxia sp. C0004]